MAIYRGNGGSVEGITEADILLIAVSQGGTGATTASGARTNLGLGTAATTNATAYATAAQGTLADSAVQPSDVGTAAAQNVGYFATAAQGTLADSAVQPADLATVATSGSYDDLSDKPTLTTSLDGLTDVVITSATTGQGLQYNGTNWVNSAGGSGSVTSVDMSVPTGLAVSGNPVTTSGTLAVTYASGYAIPTTAKQTEWDTAYGWGNHASGGYAADSAVVHDTGDETIAGTKTFSSTITGSISGNAGTATTLQTARNINGTSFNGSANVNVFTYTGTKSDNVSYHVGFYTSAAQLSQQTFVDGGSEFTYNPSTNVLTIGSGTSTNWNTAYGWGNHASAGYANNDDVVHDTGDETIAGLKTFSTGVVLGRVNSDSEGGQLDLCRSSDNALTWALDVYGNTSTPSLRFVDNVASATRMSIDGSGNVGIGTTSPSTKLEVSGTVTATAFVGDGAGLTGVAGGQYFGSAATKAIAYNSQSIAENVTVTSGNSGISAGPITISSGYAVTVQSGSRWVIV